MYLSDIGFQLLAFFCVFWLFILISGIILAKPQIGKKFKKNRETENNNMTKV